MPKKAKKRIKPQRIPVKPERINTETVSTTNDTSDLKFEPWIVQHQIHMGRTKTMAVHNGNKVYGKSGNAPVLQFDEPIDSMPKEKYDAIMHKATKNLHLRTAYSTDLPLMLIEHMSRGDTIEAFCGLPEVGVSHVVFWGWLKRYPELRVARDVGKALAQRYWEKVGGESMWVPEGVKFNMLLYRLIMMNRFGYRDKVQHEGPDGEALVGIPVLQQRYKNLDRLDVDQLRDLHKLLGMVQDDEEPVPVPGAPKMLN